MCNNLNFYFLLNELRNAPTDVLLVMGHQKYLDNIDIDIATDFNKTL